MFGDDSSSEVRAPSNVPLNSERFLKSGILVTIIIPQKQTQLYLIYQESCSDRFTKTAFDIFLK